MYTTKIKPTFCPGCGNYGIKEAVIGALKNLDIKPHQAVITFDVGCNANMADFVYTYGFHGLHGRSVPPAAGIKLINPQLTVLSLIGDGAFYGEGGTHFLNLLRADYDITVIVHNNQRFSLTTGQFSPTTVQNTVTITSPGGVPEEPINPIAVALVNHSTFVARGFAGDVAHLRSLIQAGIKHRGFSFIDVLQPCLIWNKEQSYDWYKKRIMYLEQPFANRIDAVKSALDGNQLPVGIFYQQEKKSANAAPASGAQPLVCQDISRVDIVAALKQFY